MHAYAYSADLGLCLPFPYLVHSYIAHECVGHKIDAECHAQDMSAALWTLSGACIGVFGKHTWNLDDCSTWADPLAQNMRPALRDADISAETSTEEPYVLPAGAKRARAMARSIMRRASTFVEPDGANKATGHFHNAFLLSPRSASTIAREAAAASAHEDGPAKIVRGVRAFKRAS